MTITYMTEEYARAISLWIYDDKYSFYDHNESIIAEYMDGTHFACINADEELIGYFCFGTDARIPTKESDVYNEDILDIGLGLRPDLCGKGHGLLFLNSGLSYAHKRYGTNQFRLSVAAFNERAIKVYRKAGFFEKHEVTNSHFKNKFIIMEYSMKEEIIGGTMNQVVKIGDTVRRQVKGNPMLHSYLQYLEKVGMTGVPRFLGMDKQGREILSYIPGKTAESHDLFSHPCLHSDQAICDMAHFMRRLHDVSVGFLKTALESGWTNPQLNGVDYETICHGDAAIWNFVLVNDKIAGIFDFDQACPGTRAWDLTITLFSAVLPSCYDYEPAKHKEDTRRRIQLFFDAYGMSCPCDIIVQTADRIQVWCDEEAARGQANIHYQNVSTYLRRHIYDWV